MKTKKEWLGILVMVLVFGVAVVGCDNSTESDFGDITITVTGLDPAAFPNANNFWVELVGAGTVASPGWPPTGTSQTFHNTSFWRGEYHLRLVIAENVWTGTAFVMTILFEGTTTGTFSVPGNHSVPLTAFN